MKPYTIFFLRWILNLALSLPATLSSQSDTTFHTILFYNVENLFHPENDSLKNDDAFTPDGLNRWTYKRYFQKINHLAKTILAVNKGFPPEAIGLAEIENEKVLCHLCYSSPLKAFHYQYVHFESPDRRGVDVAFIYRKDAVSILYKEPVGIIFPFEPTSKNRDILYVRFRFPQGDTVHLFINHWTSRFGGYAATIPKRNYYAQCLKKRIESLRDTFPNPYIVVVGDFNDYPQDESLSEILKAKPISEKRNAFLVNLMIEYAKAGNIGTHKHEDFWGCLDQVLVSPNLLGYGNFSVLHHKAYIMEAPFLLVDDPKYGGCKTFRTFLGLKYWGGFSDHLPVFIRLRKIFGTLPP